MTPSISDVTYAYPIASTIGTVTISEGSSIDKIREAYENLFENEELSYTGKANKLLEYVNTILQKEIRLDGDDIEEIIAGIFDKDDIISKNTEDYKESKEGLKAYKFYLKEVLTKLYNLNQVIKDANAAIAELGEINATTEEELNNQAHVLITKLQCYDKQAQDLIKAFTEYSVIKTLNVTKYITYNDGESYHQEQTDQRTYDCIETEYRPFEELIDRTKSLDNIGIQTKKLTVIRKYTTSYYKTDPITGQSTEQLTDKYDLLAYIKTEITPEEVSTGNTSELALFDELTLLEKLQYILKYYSSNNPRYVFPEDKKIGYPCIVKQESKDALNDTKEIGQVEMFYLGYIINRDGPINALASFLEIKVTAIKSQIKVLMERIKAIKAYSTLLQKGFEQFSSVAKTYGAQSADVENARPAIPQSAFYIYRYLSTSATRCFYYVNGEPYIMVQYSHAKANKGEFCKDEGKGTDSIEPNDWNVSPTGYYILVKPTEEGLNAFVNFLNKIPTCEVSGWGYQDIHRRSLDLLFTEKLETNKPNINDNRYEYWYYGKNRYYHLFLKDVNENENSFSYYVRLDKTSDSKGDAWEDMEESPKNDWYSFLKTNEVSADKNYIKFKQINKEDLPKKLDVPKIAGTTMTHGEFSDGFGWNDLTPDNAEKKAVLVGYFGQWQNSYETQIANYKTNLEQQEKEITTLQKKIQTFDATSTNFRNKVFTVYNKIVNKIK